MSTCMLRFPQKKASVYVSLVGFRLLLALTAITMFNSDEGVEHGPYQAESCHKSMVFGLFLDP